MNIRNATESDLPLLATFAKELWLTHADEAKGLLNKEYIEKSDAEKYFLDSITSKDSFIVLAEEEKTIVGYCKLDIKEIDKFFVQSRILYIDEIYVVKEARGQGISKILLKEAEKIAKQHNITLLKARIYTFNKESRGLFEKDAFNKLYSEYFKILK